MSFKISKMCDIKMLIYFLQVKAHVHGRGQKWTRAKMDRKL